MPSKTKLTTKILMTTTESEDDEGLTPSYVYILIEFAYILMFGIVAYLMRRYNFMKTEDDAVTKHHRRHYEMMKKQQDELIEKQRTNENFLIAGDNQ
ncbi:hypothetical protein L5515_000865 [Caenorhabditis briggsae]|uniref:Uncharacterized protein n=2 Tax=Caenorhabditis briggsae TaxID=6238 RepID=A0AAE9DU52_CAEBR|nr:hypothetical protein L3Y34_014790 [Caenorhabditis briggsae]UMM11723.1 hypothetical protein L5515_000865 [Caenorhabditis briggsae]